jgi:hypothetical protein
MRFLLVHRQEVSAARSLIDSLDVQEIEIVIYNGEKQPSPDVLERFRGSQLALVGVRDKYRKALQRGCSTYSFSVSYFSSLSVAAATLRGWLAPVAEIAPENLPKPSKAFIKAAQEQPRLILAQGALDRADQLSLQRYTFANAAARALSDYAARAGTRLGDLSTFFPNPQFYYARNGQIRASYIINADGNEVKRGSTEQHLKKGDATTQDNAARIYFDTVEFRTKVLVVILYCGPHPTSSFTALVDLTGV